MSYVNARLTVRGRALLIERVIGSHRPVAHVAKELGISRQCAHRWVRRYKDEGPAGLLDRSSRPRCSPTRTSPDREQVVLESRSRLRAGPLRIAADTGVPARTVSRVLARHHVPPLSWCDPMTGELIRASRATENRYEYERPGEMVHVDVKKLGRIPDGGGWRADLTQTRRNHVTGHQGVGFDYVHAVIDDHSRLAYAEIHSDEKGVTAAGVLCELQRSSRHAVSPRSSGSFRTTRSPTGNRPRSRTPSPSLAQFNVSSSPIAPGRTAKLNASTAPCKPSGPIGRSSPAMTNDRPLLRPGWTSTTLNASTPASEQHPSAECHQRHDAVHLVVAFGVDAAGFGPPVPRREEVRQVPLG